MAECKTVKVQDGKGGHVVINESDYQGGVHKPYGDKSGSRSSKSDGK